MTYTTIQNFTSASNAALAQPGYMIGIDFALNKNPRHTHFRDRWVPYAQFSFETLSHTVENARYGETGIVRFGKLSDLVWKTYLRYVRCGIEGKASGSPSTQFPHVADECGPCGASDRAYFTTLGAGDLEAGIDAHIADNYGGVASGAESAKITPAAAEGDAEPEAFAHYCNVYATAAATKITAMCGSQPLDTLTRTHIFKWSETEISASQRMGYNEMVGRAYSRKALVADSMQEKVLYQEIPFWHTSTPSKALAIICGLYSPVEYHIQFAPLREMVVRSGPEVRVVKAGTDTELSEGDLRVSLDAVHIYLQSTERDRFGLTPYDLIVPMHKQHNFTVTGQSVVSLAVQCPHLVTEVNWTVQRKCHRAANEHFNFSGRLGMDPIHSAAIEFAGAVPHQQREAPFWRLVQNRCHTAIPSEHIYSCQFSLCPESSKPNGGAGLARFDGLTVKLWLAPGLEQEEVHIDVLLTYQQLLKMRNGVIGRAFG